MRCIHIHPKDNIAIVTQDVPAGADVICDDRVIVARNAIPRFHKIAVTTIADGSEVRRYGLPIGLAVGDIQPGELVHLHNIRSAWIPTYTREQQDENNAHGA